MPNNSGGTAIEKKKNTVQQAWDRKNKKITERIYPG
jgi:hypothetical protein